ncbi:MAG: type I DNA topoisomerase [Planctomycetaceae bacterium]|nr:type I DNA topoisomerase [Planctomycetaceae bacterium]
MAKKASSSGGKSLVIVESPAKARTIGKFLGKDYTVEASIGHIRDLPQGSKEVPEEFKKESWSYLGVNVDDRFTPIYIVPPGKKQQVAKLRAALKDAKDLYLATDEDREGEAISWHLHEVLKPKVPVKRLVFHEITKEAIQEAIDNPREIDDGLVRAQEARRILDRLYGYDVSQLLWKKVGRGLSAGRVQSVSVRLIVERERQRMAFHSATYWDLMATFASESSEEFQATLMSVDGRKIPSGKDFDAATGKIKDDSLLVLDEAGAKALNDRLRSAQFKVLSVESKPYTRKPAPPFTTSTMQQEANRKLGFTARRTMNAAQSLYENGHITYMRTDSTNLAQVAVDAARDLVNSEYGNDYLPETPRTYANKVKNAQEAHEAIRPAGHPFELPGALKNSLNSDEYRLFEMIWKRTIASQMVDARGHNTTITIEGDGAIFRVSGRTIDFPGFLRAYVEGSDNPNAELADRETLLPSVEQGQRVDCRDLQANDHTTQPPSRFTEASLTRELEDKGIGRPSTYASIIDTIQARDYVFKKGNALVPTWTAFAVTRLLEDHFGSLVDYQFTAQMEDLLDSISRREADSVDYLQNFYFGDEPGLKARLAAKTEEIDPRVMSRFPVGTPTEGEHREEIVLRVGKFGPFVEQGERKASLPEGMAPDELTLARAMELLDQGAASDEPLGICPETHKPVFLKVGRFGPYVQRGTPEDDEKPKNASLLKGMVPEDISLEIALKLLTLPRTLGEHPELKAPVVSQNGRFGPYISCGKETRSLPADLSPIDVTFEKALELLAQPKTRGRGAAKEPIKEFEASPVTEQPIKLLEGRYGPYVTDGETNASLPKGTNPEEFTFDQAVVLLAERAAKGPTKKKKKKAAPKKAAKKKPAKKKVAKKKTDG